MKFCLVIAAAVAAVSGFAQVVTDIPEFPPVNGRDHNKLLGGLSHGTERFDSISIGFFSDGVLLTKGWDGTVKGHALSDIFSGGHRVSSDGDTLYSFDLQYKGAEGTASIWTLTDGVIQTDAPGGDPLEKIQWRQDFGQVKADRHTEVIGPDVTLYDVSCSFDANMFVSHDGGSTYDASGITTHFTLQTVPEPCTLAILVPGVLCLRRRSNKPARVR